jgi:hypothetical protein
MSSCRLTTFTGSLDLGAAERDAPLPVHHDLVAGTNDEHIPHDQLGRVNRSLLPFSDDGRLGAHQQRDPVERALGAAFLHHAHHHIHQHQARRDDRVARAPHQNQNKANRKQDLLIKVKAFWRRIWR